MDLDFRCEMLDIRRMAVINLVFETCCLKGLVGCVVLKLWFKPQKEVRLNQEKKDLGMNRILRNRS